MNKTCPRCSAPFVCRVDQISLCNCKKVVLKEGVRNYIKTKYGNCLCIDCLSYINDNFDNIKESPEPYHI